MAKDYMYTGYNPSLRKKASSLRHEMTPHERRLWFCFLKAYPVRFRRQRTIGHYIVDFYCSDAGLVVELDGSQHYDDKGKEYDSERTAFLEQYGLQVIRFSDREINCSFEAVCEAIDLAVKKRLSEKASGVK